MLTSNINKKKVIKYKLVVISRKSPPEMLQVVEEELDKPERNDISTKLISPGLMEKHDVRL